MIDKRRNVAKRLRAEGLSIKTIALQLGAAQSSVSVWVRNVKLTDEQIRALSYAMHSKEAIEKRRQSRLRNEAAKRLKIVETARREITNISTRELWLIGTALYWAEGSKRQNTVQFSNGDPRMIMLMMRYFRYICGVPVQKMRGYIHIHEHLDTQEAERYWQTVTKLPKSQFYKTYNKPNKSSKGTRNTLPYGVCDIYVLDAHFLLRIKGWIEGIYESSTQMIK